VYKSNTANQYLILNNVQMHLHICSAGCATKYLTRINQKAPLGLKDNFTQA